MCVDFSLPPIIWVLPGVCERHNAAVWPFLRASKRKTAWFLNLPRGHSPRIKGSPCGLELAGKEEAVRKLRELELERQANNLVPMAEAKEVIRRVLEPLRNLLDVMPKAVAIQANPGDPILAEEAIRDGLRRVFQMMQEHRKKEQQNVSRGPSLCSSNRALPLPPRG